MCFGLGEENIMVKESKILHIFYALSIKLKDVVEKSVIMGVLGTLFSGIFNIITSSSILGFFAVENKTTATIRPLSEDNALLGVLRASLFVRALDFINVYYVIEHIYIVSFIFLPTTLSVVLGFVVILNSIYRSFRVGFRFSLTHILTMMFAVILLLSGIFGLYPKQAYLMIAVYTVYIWSAVLMTAVLNDRKKIVAMTYGVVFAVAAASLYGFYQYVVGVEIDPSWVDTKMFNSTSRIFSVFDNPNVYGIFLVATLPLIIGLGLREKNPFLKFIFFGIFAAGFVNIFLTMSRGSIIGIAVAVFLMAVFIDRRFLYLAILLVLLSPFILPESILNRVMSIGNLKESSSAYRISIYVATIKMIGDFIVAGVGLGSFKMVFHNYAFAASKSFHAHNTFLMVFAENGIIGFTVLIALLISFTRDVLFAVVNTKSKDKFLLLGFFGGIYGVSVQALFEHIWHNYDVMFLYFFLILIASSLARSFVKEVVHD